MSPRSGAVDEVLALLALPMLGGVVAVCDGVYRAGTATEIVDHPCIYKLPSNSARIAA